MAFNIEYYSKHNEEACVLIDIFLNMIIDHITLILSFVKANNESVINIMVPLHAGAVLKHITEGQ